MAKGKMTRCAECGKPFAAAAKACPYCGEKNRKKKSPVLKIVLGVLCAFVLIGVIGAMLGGDDDSDKPKKVEGTNASQSNGEKEKDNNKEDDKTAFGVGEQVSLNDVIVTMNNVTESNGSQFNEPAEGNVFILCEFTIENNSEKDLAVSSIMCFEAYVDDYSTSMSLSAIIGAEKNQLDRI